ncbi:uncharacterized protein PGTG_11051 [Puccinia graminis f. sp. tritici CRL 75-36-700-3]|uniref:Tet-like 2OG-Fe(II) oxygenase domain-containing protein n=1 Tax=Puccinia graminis f. sp. tritici (strain CRL 75-36-700-3 / race SCCL) TaxID=418459 RepID=E3KN86_PUCGT|nr:uncharacterized protein PGTG_11051 [Puccinia graminis f. sp. tritici CRL 75-36-700-3]EFP85722.2 hypothetical protein PGTG_11051 [Puccinia graminis f. sp. tritici CRL 75-36-700-3]
MIKPQSPLDSSTRPTPMTRTASTALNTQSQASHDQSSFMELATPAAQKSRQTSPFPPTYAAILASSSQKNSKALNKVTKSPEASTKPNIKCSGQLASFPPATSTYAAIVAASANRQLQNTIATVPDSEQLPLQSSPDLSWTLANKPSNLTSLDDDTDQIPGAVSDKSSTLSDLSSSEKDTENTQPMPSHKPKKRKRKRGCDMTPHQRQKRNQNLNKRRKGKRVKNSLNSFTTAVPPPGAQTIQRNVDHLDLFPAITQDFCQRISEYKRLLADYENDPNNLQKPPKVYACSPTKEENESALKTVKKSFYTIDSNYNKIYDKKTNELVAIVEFIPLEDLSKSQWNDYDFLCLFLHQCKEFISPVSSKSRKCGGIMWAMGWRKAYNGLEILGRYRNQAV